MQVTGPATRKRYPPTMHAIAKFWAESLDLLADREDERPLAWRGAFAAFQFDPTEPCCFGCGWRIPEYDGFLLHSWEQRWRDAGRFLERAHLVAHSLGGSDSPYNYVPLCPVCHVTFDTGGLFQDRDAAIADLATFPQMHWSLQLQLDQRYEGQPLADLAAIDWRYTLKDATERHTKLLMWVDAQDTARLATVDPEDLHREFVASLGTDWYEVAAS